MQCDLNKGPPHLQWKKNPLMTKLSTSFKVQQVFKLIAMKACFFHIRPLYLIRCKKTKIGICIQYFLFFPSRCREYDISGGRSLFQAVSIGVSPRQRPGEGRVVDQAGIVLPAAVQTGLWQGLPRGLHRVPHIEANRGVGGQFLDHLLEIQSFSNVTFPLTRIPSRFQSFTLGASHLSK